MTNIYSDVNICSICSTSTINEPFDMNGKRYVLCDCCKDVISYVVEQTLNNKSKQSGN